MLHREVEERNRERKLDCAPRNEKTGQIMKQVQKNSFIGHV